MSWLIPDWQKTIVFIGQYSGKSKNFIGTGVVLGISGVYCLITAKHVIFDKEEKERENLFVSFNSKDNKIIDRDINEIKKYFSVEWTCHENKNVDITIIPFGFDEEKDDIRVITEDLFQSLKEDNIAEDVFFLGFQPGLSLTRVKPVIRLGIISRLEEDKTFYIDTTAFPGNSGSPVILKPSPITFSENSFNIGPTHKGRFIGIIGEYVTYQEFAISEQTGKPRIMFEENTGLSRVWPIDYIKEIVSTTKFQEKLKEINKKNGKKS